MQKTLLIITGCIWLAGSLPVHAQSDPGQLYALGMAQKMVSDTKSERSIELHRLVDRMELQYGVSFMYNADLKDLKIRNVYDPSLESVTDQIEKLIGNSDLTYKEISNDFFVIRRMETEKKERKQPRKTVIEQKVRPEHAQLMARKMQAEDLVVSGVVRDGQGEALPGVNVMLIKGSSTGAITDAQGKFSVLVPESQTNGVLVFSYIGFLTQEVPISGRSSIDVVLKEDITELQEIVVVGYGTQKSESVTGAISSISAKEVSALPVASVESAMQGRMPGVSVVNNGAPGETPIVRIRGIGSISFASNPLYVIDGIPVQGGLNNFDPKDIASVDVLKDASAAAIYGSRAANGVIMITTKKGTDRKLQIDLDSYIGVQNAWKKLDMLNTDQYLDYARMLKDNRGEEYPDRITNMNVPVYPGASQTYAETNTDWQDEMFRSAQISHTHLSINGGNDVSNFFSSVGYFQQEGIMLGAEYERLNFRFNSDHKFGKRLTFGQNLFLSYDDRLNDITQSDFSAGGRTQIKHMLHSLPYIPVYDPTETGGFRAASGEDGSDAENPVRIALQDRLATQTLRVLTNAYLKLDLTNWLSYQFTAGIDYSSSRTNLRLPIYTDGFRGREQARLGQGNASAVSPIFTNQLTFEKSYGKHHLNAVGVIERQTAITENLLSGGFFYTNELDQLNGAVNQSVLDTRTEIHLISYVGRLNYEYAGKYLLSASLRRDGSSVFAPGSKWGTFPAASVGWRVSEEPFLREIQPISELKIRASYGQLGFNGIGAYDWQTTINQNTTAIIGGNPAQGAFFDILGNTELEWEVTTMWNLGLDFGLFNNALQFSMEAYNRNVDNLILQVPIAPSMGYGQNPIANVGEMKNWGYEFQLGYTKASGDFTWNATGNIGIVRNEVVQLATPSSSIVSGSIPDFEHDITRTQAGHYFQGFYGYVVDGIFQSEDEVFNAPRQEMPADMADYDPQSHTAPGDIRFKDLNGDGVIDANDRQYLGSFLPDFNYGLNLSANYKNFDVTVFFQGVQGNKIFNLVKFYTQGTPRLFGAGVEVLDGWTPENTNTDIPRMIDSDPNKNSRMSDRFIEDGSYLRVKNLSIGYSVPSQVLSTFANGAIRNARIYVSSLNLLTFTKYSGYDPEIGSRFNNVLTNGIDYGQYPSPRTFMVGLQVGF